MAVVKLVTLNTWGRTAPWRERLAVIANGLRALDPHVIGLQEIWQDDSNSAQDIADAIGGEWHVYYGPAWEVENRSEGNAVLSRFPIVESETWPLPAPTHDHDRNLVYVVAATPWGKLPVFVTHLSWMFHHGAARLQQLMQVREWMKERAPIQKGGEPSEMLPPVFMGDLNAEPVADEIRFLHGYLADPYGFYLADCWARCGDGPGHTWDRRNAYAAREPHPDRRLDYIFVRGPDRWRRGEPAAAKLVLDAPVDGVFASDHFGLYAELRVS